jgi:hypothetical protein
MAHGCEQRQMEAETTQVPNACQWVKTLMERRKMINKEGSTHT